MKLRVSTCLTLVVVLIGVMSSASAGASEPRASSARILERAYGIDIALDQAELKVRLADVVRAENRTQDQMTSCLTGDLVQTVDAEQSESNAQTALQSLSEEAGAQYEIRALKPVLAPVLRGLHQLLKLPLPATSRSSVRSYLTGLSEVQSLNVCADAQAWLSAGLAAAQEPSGTAQTATAVADLHSLTGGSDHTGTGSLTSDQRRAVKAEQKLADRHVKQLTSQTERSLESWIEQLGVSIQRTATTTTQTSTTAT